MMLFFGNDHTIRNFSQTGKPSVDSETRPPAVRRPRHCGEDMQLTMQTATAPGDSLPPGLEPRAQEKHPVWQCHCGFRLDPKPDPREAVWAAAAAVETCQWEMDHAIQQLHHALRTASAKGATDDLLAESAQLPRKELQTILRPAEK